ncbi:hotdog fold domain-containing protein [Dactylosporangium sp. NPDC049525]|uniref:hotdog fold domain-containing protein n=1 Tax=Dactylosporangium sp. NPDC049525 TaxID=3154730 RepID=UPI003430A285
MRILLRLRCTGSGDLSVRVSGRTFSDDGRLACTGRWTFGQGNFPPNAEPRDPGPYRAAISGPGTVTSWEVEAYETDPAASPSKPA